MANGPHHKAWGRIWTIVYAGVLFSGWIKLESDILQTLFFAVSLFGYLWFSGALVVPTVEALLGTPPVAKQK